ncbi:hypothetical protein [Terrabacter sp. Ter38]|uniref:hypothetical protein n=1 Tax=Terrabacter sp. Ter38 TaxID=2926030 RepID=UPI002117413C|nr:hypothetical protein [Terrabacter sp. Ter38]
MTGLAISAHPLLTGTPALIPAHGVGSRKDLPLPFTYLLVGAAVVLVLSFIALVVFWREPRVRDHHGVLLPRFVAAFLNSRVVRAGAAAVSLLLFAVTVAALAFGADDATNPAPYLVFVWLWVGVLAMSLVFGPVWVVLNPIRWIHLGVCRLARVDPDTAILRYRLGYWPAALGLFAFTWLELVAPDRTSQAVLGSAVALFIVMDLLGAFLFGRTWFQWADPFEVLSRLYGALSLLGHRPDRRWVLRSPLAGLEQIPVRPGLLGAVAVMLGSTAYDGFSANPAWFGFSQASPVPVLTQTAGLVAMIAFVIATVSLAGWAGAVLSGTDARGMAAVFAPSLVPIAAGYAVAHYWSLGVYAGQYTLTLLTDPLGTGGDYLGTRHLTPGSALIAPTLVATLQAAAIVLGHVVGIVHAHERAVSRFDRRGALLGQLPMLALMVLYTCGGLLLLFSS